jgi:hypothetical protein
MEVVPGTAVRFRTASTHQLGRLEAERATLPDGTRPIVQRNRDPVATFILRTLEDLSGSRLGPREDSSSSEEGWAGEDLSGPRRLVWFTGFSGRRRGSPADGAAIPSGANALVTAHIS